MVEQDFDNPRRWTIEKPFLADFFVPYSIYDPTFHKWKATKVPEPLDPCCTSCREPDSALTVVVYVHDESYLPALEFVLTNATKIEAALRIKLAALNARCLVDHLEENLPGMPEWTRHWEFMTAELGGDPSLRIDRTYKLTGLSIVRSDPEGEWATGFEFQSAWDMDHGVEIVMWGDRVLCAEGMLEGTSTGGSVFAKARETQKYQLDEGDFRLP